MKDLNAVVPVLAEPLQALSAEPGNSTHTRSGGARESTELSAGPQQGETVTADSRGGVVQKSWVFTWRVEPPPCQTVSVRFGASVMFAAYMPHERQWYMICGSYQERIEEPPMWFCSDEWAATHQRDNIRQRGRRENPLRTRKKKAEQLCLL